MWNPDPAVVVVVCAWVSVVIASWLWVDMLFVIILICLLAERQGGRAANTRSNNNSKNNNPPNILFILADDLGSSCSVYFNQLPTCFLFCDTYDVEKWISQVSENLLVKITYRVWKSALVFKALKSFSDYQVSLSAVDVT